MAAPPRRALSRALLVASTLGVAYACGSAKPPPLGDDVPPGGDGGVAVLPDGNIPLFHDAQTKPPGCGVGPEGGVCECSDVQLLTDVPNLYFVLDRSGSMTDQDKWGTIRVVTSQTVLKLGPRINVGVAVFPDPANDNCSPGVEVMKVRPGDAPAGSFGPTNQILLGSLSMGASGGTPTSATLSGLQSKLAALPGRTFVILATDGGPNCNPSASCTIDQCIPNIESTQGCAPTNPPNCCQPSLFGPLNCLDGDATVAAVTALKSAGISTYVMGVPGSGPYASVLNKMATAGGTAQATSPFYYDVQSADATAFAAALSTIAAKITATCTLTLKTTPANPDLVNVYLDEIVVPKDPVDGWSLQGATVTLLGAACNKVMTGAVLDVRIIEGCPTVLR